MDFFDTWQTFYLRVPQIRVPVPLRPIEFGSRPVPVPLNLGPVPSHPRDGTVGRVPSQCVPSRNQSLVQIEVLTKPQLSEHRTTRGPPTWIIKKSSHHWLHEQISWQLIRIPTCAVNFSIIGKQANILVSYSWTIMASLYSKLLKIYCVFKRDSNCTVVFIFWMPECVSFPVKHYFRKSIWSVFVPWIDIPLNGVACNWSVSIPYFCYPWRNLKPK